MSHVTAARAKQVRNTIATYDLGKPRQSVTCQDSLETLLRTELGKPLTCRSGPFLDEECSMASAAFLWTKVSGRCTRHLHPTKHYRACMHGKHSSLVLRDSAALLFGEARFCEGTWLCVQFSRQQSASQASIMGRCDIQGDPTTRAQH